MTTFGNVTHKMDISRGQPRPPFQSAKPQHHKFFVTQMLTCDLFAVANLPVHTIIIFSRD